ncbi:transporter substrate-binding domain-containing protein, partial [bacterium]|nr:transporter substrate-binding domain-containing protein [bacterium]
MFKKITVLIVVLLSLTLTWYIRQYNSKHTSAQIGKTLIVGTSADYYPFAFIKDDEYAGFDLDIIKKIGNIINKDIIIKNM